MFSSHALFREQPGEVIFKDRFRSVELATGFKRLTCYHCELSALYKFHVQQLRRHPQIEVEEGEEVRPDHQEIWERIPRFAEIPETIRCKRCREVLGLYTFCIF